MKHRRVLVALVMAAAVALIAVAALARPGGGSSFSGGGGSDFGSSYGGGGGSGGSSSSSGGGDGDGILGALFEILVRLIIELAVAYPQVSVPLVVVAVIVVLLTRRDAEGRAKALSMMGWGALMVLPYFSPWAFIGVLSIVLGVSHLRSLQKRNDGWVAAILGGSRLRSQQKRDDDWVAAMDAEHGVARPAVEGPLTASDRAATPSAGARAKLLEVRAFDPDFSLVVLEDFLYALYAEVQRARGADALDTLVAYTSDDVRARLGGAGLAAVEDVIVGALRLQDVDGVSADAERTSIRVEFEANYTEVSPDGARQGVRVVERWRVARPGGVKSRAPERARVIGCPACGAPRDRSVGGVCGYCQASLTRGDLDWSITGIEVVTRDLREPVLGSTVEERGTDLPTVRSPTLVEDLAALSIHDPAFSVASLRPRIELIFGELQVAWSTREWKRARPFVTDLLFTSQRAWIEAYRKAGLRNLTDGARVLDVEPAAVTLDRWFHAVTVRVRATGKDYTVDEDDALASGDRERERAYTEYWTLIRSATRRGAARASLVCPNCGAALAINQAGECEFCAVVVTTGEFDWVLSRIEQDDSYSG
jgi:predicted lipid-binding transport protein (Tim44 family)